MIVYNVTIKIIPGIEHEWLHWQHHVHIPDIMATGLFTEWKMFRLLEQDESDGITYVMQYYTPSEENYIRYIENHAPLMREKVFEKWGDQFIAFRTVMKAVH